ncbi:MAG: hypothetical protein DIU78_012605 [Pseudomonadota bacterium]
MDTKKKTRAVFRLGAASAMSLLVGSFVLASCSAGGAEPPPDWDGSGGASLDSGGMGGAPTNGGSANGGAPTASGGGTVGSPNGGTSGTGAAGSSGAPTTGGSGGIAAMGGTAGTPTTGGSAGTPTNGGSANGGGGQGGMPPSGGAAGSADGGMAGKSTGGNEGGAPMGGDGGMAGMSGGAGGSGGSGGSTMSGGKAPADPSAGCGKANPQTGSGQNPLTVSGHQYYVKLPNGYDANKPYPVLFMFNPTNNPITWAEQNAGFESNGARDAWIRVYPHPANPSSGWGANDVSFFQPLYDTITNNFCVDKARVFAAGESSGGDFSSILGCEHADKVRAVAPCATKPVQQYPLTVAQRSCTGQVTAVVIHGKSDNVVGPENGPRTRDFYLQLNHCGSSSEPVQGYTDSLSNCVRYQGCDEGYPVFWCQHSDPEYNNTNHGWPRFAAKFIWEHFSTY